VALVRWVVAVAGTAGRAVPRDGPIGLEERPELHGAAQRRSSASAEQEAYKGKVPLRRLWGFSTSFARD